MKRFFALKLWILVSISLVFCDTAAFAIGNKKVVQLLTQASQLLCNGDYDKAIKTCDDITAIDQNCPAAYYLRGFARRYKKEYELAITDFTLAVKIDPKYAAAYFGRAMSYAYTRNYDNALADFNAAIAVDPRYTDAYINRARVYYEIDDYDKAWDDVHKAESLGVSKDMLYKGFINKLKEASGRNR
ncbi:MAG: tetratricopeptide repeat protein [Candidatus Omnitrophica bacterium]|nr:tetratricopeptide repeat protein [Candidatus Omnitrophota bacterium]